MARFSLLRLVVLAAAVLTPSMPVAAAPPATGGDRCAAPEDITADTSPMASVAAVLKPAGVLNVLTVGSATVFSPDESLKPGTVTGQALGLGNGARSGELPMPSEAAFPLQMADVLRALNPGLTVNVTVRGGRGMTAAEMLDIIRSELADHHYQLVIWQTGTVEAVRNIPPATFYQTLSDGAVLVSDAGADMVLVDPQYSRFLHANTDLDPYAQAMQQIAGLPGVILFHRFELMRYWVNEGQIDLERTPKGQRVKTVEALHACLGSRLARMIMASALQQP